jgi:hypothetical protein
MKDRDAIHAMRLVVENYERLAAITEGKEQARADKPGGDTRPQIYSGTERLEIAERVKLVARDPPSGAPTR